jgi:hypothetical protein
LPRQQRPAFRWREGDDEGGFASTRHIAPLCDTCEDDNNRGFQAFSGDNAWEARPRRQHRWSPDKMLSEKTIRSAGVPARPARDVTVLDRPTSRVLQVPRPWKPCEHASVGAHRPWTAHHAWNSSQQVRPHRAPATGGPSLPACPRPPPSPGLRRQTVPGSRGSGADTVRSVNHTVSRYIWESVQHGFVGQVWSGPGVSIRPTRCPLRPAVRRDEPEDRLKG